MARRGRSLPLMWTSTRGGGGCQPMNVCGHGGGGSQKSRKKIADVLCEWLFRWTLNDRLWLKTGHSPLKKYIPLCELITKSDGYRQ